MARIFVGIDLPREGREALARVQARLRQEVVGCGRVSWVAPETFHLTLRFLGEVAEEQVEQALAGCRRIAEETTPFPLWLGGIALLPSRQEARVIVVRVGGELAPLHRLQQRIEEVVRGVGLRAERRRFDPHITLGRVRPTQGDHGSPPIVWEAIVPRLRFLVNEIHLKESELRPSGARHTCRATFPLVTQGAD